MTEVLIGSLFFIAVACICAALPSFNPSKCNCPDCEREEK